MSDELLFDVSDFVAIVTINRPDKKNAFTDDMVREWVQRLDEFNSRDDVRAIVFTGAGDTFSSGGDVGGLKEKAEQSPLEAKSRVTSVTHSLIRKVAEIDKPLIAAVNGAAVGGGVDVALMCDVRLASASARFSETYARMGLVPGVGGAWLLPRLVGSAAALDLFWTSRWVSAQEALSLGLVNHVYPDDTFRDQVRQYATLVASQAPVSVRAIKRLVRQSQSTDLTTHLDGLSSLMAIVRTSDDHKEAVAAFREKRKPRFKGS